MTQFVQLSQPPVAIALFQMKFNANNISIEDFEHCDSTLKSIFPIRKDNVSVGINLQSPSIPLGKASIKETSDAKLSSLIYVFIIKKIIGHKT